MVNPKKAMIMTDFTDVKLTVREAIEQSRCRACHPALAGDGAGSACPGGDTPGIDDPDKTCAVAYPDRQAEFPCR